jgi:hypothetical protein
MTKASAILSRFARTVEGLTLLGAGSFFSV